MIIKKCKKFKEVHPIAAYLLVSKVLVIIGSIFGMWLTLTPMFSFLTKTVILIVYNVVLLPVGYWLTYCFPNDPNKSK